MLYLPSIHSKSPLTSCKLLIMQSVSVLKMECHVHCEAYKDRLACSVILIIPA